MEEVEFELTEEQLDVLEENAEEYNLDRETVLNIAIESALKEVENYADENGVSMAEAFVEVVGIDPDQ